MLMKLILIAFLFPILSTRVVHWVDISILVYRTGSYLLVPVTPHASPVTVYAYPVPTIPIGYRTVYYRY